MVIIMKMYSLKYEVKLPFAKSSFKKYILNIDLSQLNKVDVDENNSTVQILC
jgi:hypothetical protein